MFCHPATAPFAIKGAILSVGAEAYEASSDSLTTVVTDSGAKVDKEILLKQMSVLSQGGDVLVKDLGENTKKMEDSPAKVVNGPETEAGKAAFAAFVDAISDRSDILQKYNLSIVRLAKLRLEIIDGNKSLGIFEGSLPSVSGDHMLIDLTWEKALKYGFSPKWFDIRLKGMQVYLFGARVDINKLPQEARGSADADKTIRLTLESSGNFRYIEEQAKLHEYSMPSNTFEFSYKIFKASESEEHQNNSEMGAGDAIAYEMVSSLEEGDKFELALPNLGINEKFSLQSPLGAWTVYVDPSVDLTDLTEVHFVFDLALRTSSDHSV
ncbi:hypothetical protein BOTCAL_0007g00420 [Botryotinia calthae]|uniref:Uncharacterized protein n=1 Tax=Botryotinia calthae TaxID=38488 RepID=A0A4Y8DJN0_9HELO|nr:hypothetical protein BOTCAL_0007g00420 [Botryotinia calthae]